MDQMSNDVMKKFTFHLQNVLNKAYEFALAEIKESINLVDSFDAEKEKIFEISTTNILEAIYQERGSIASEILSKTSTKTSNAELGEQNQKENFVKIKNENIQINFSSDVKQCILKAVKLSYQRRHKYVGTEHLLKVIIDQKSPQTENWFKKRQINSVDLKKNLHIVLESTSKFPDLTSVFRSKTDSQDIVEEKHQNAFEYFGKELTGQEVQKDIDPLIGREKEVERLIHILCRRYKNNPILLGEAGVGKTAIVEGLAKKIMLGEVPPVLADKKIYTIDLGLIVAGTVYRGEFEARLKSLIESAEKAGDIILFIDELHTIMGAGSASGSLDAANMLKPALARGKISVIGATTLEEYKKHIETDSALERRLQPILIEEPSDEETLNILRGIKEHYERFHNVNITDDAIKEAVALSSRYLTEKLQPDKAIDLIDEAAAKVKVGRSTKSVWTKIKDLERQVEKIRQVKKSSVENENYSQAFAAKQKEEDAKTSLAKLKLIARQSDAQRELVKASHIRQIISSLTNIPIGELEIDERKGLMDLEKKIGEKIIGQNEAIKKIANLIRRARTNIGSPKKPTASFMFLGPSGVGKTETAEVLAEILFLNQKSLIRIDMSEFSEGFTTSKLIGAPAGYVGYRDSNKFTDLVRRKPYSVVLLDEIEKAHPEIFNLLLQILEDGHITDSTGRTVNFKNTIIIMTSNIGLDEFNQAAMIGFKDEGNTGFFKSTENSIIDELDKYFKKEFLNRIDRIVVFNPLSKEDLKKIVEKYAFELNSRIKDRKISLEISDRAKEEIVKKSYNPKIGARSIRRFFQDNIESELAQYFLEQGGSLKAAKITLDLKGGSLKFNGKN